MSLHKKVGIAPGLGIASGRQEPRGYGMQQKWTRAFLWISVIAWGLLVGAKLFDLRVLVGAWSASPPESLILLPYGPQWPVDTGEFFIPSSATLLLATFGALIAGWRTPVYFRILLALSATMILAVLILTVTEFWPRNAALWRAAQATPNALHDHVAIIKMVHDWVVLDWVRVAAGCVGFLASIRAISVPFPPLMEPTPTSLPMKIAYGAGLAAVLVFIFYLVSKV
jgi:Domain of unknown function (DUF1772)